MLGMLIMFIYIVDELWSALSDIKYSSSNIIACWKSMRRKIWLHIVKRLTGNIGKLLMPVLNWTYLVSIDDLVNCFVCFRQEKIQ